MSYPCGDAPRNGGAEADEPDDADDTGGAGEFRFALRPHRMADGDVALGGEGHDGQNGRVCGGFRQNVTQHAQHVTKDPRILLPQREQLHGHS